MSDTVIQFENIGKLYSLGVVGTHYLTHDVHRWWVTKILRKEDPYLKIGEVNDRRTKGTSDFVWALRDITFDIGQGEVVGIIGRNGAGKSTLLKLLSRITSPTVGAIRAKGRIASLLEVGTGFHPEMTGRENIYMNGAIMGMTKREITRKMDEIVDFAGVERYVDTPVKRYSSGMSVRLGFAVAAFLEPEILVVDEVLAVGDAEFQKKAVGKMQDISSSAGRTVLFVSHNMASVSNLCSKGILMDNGQISYIDEVDKVIERYINTRISEDSKITDQITSQSKWMHIDAIRINGESRSNIVVVPNSKFLEVEIEGSVEADVEFNLMVRLKTKANEPLATFCPEMMTGEVNAYKRGNFLIHEYIALPDVFGSGLYNVDIRLSRYGSKTYMNAQDCAELNVMGNTSAYGRIFMLKDSGIICLGRYNE
jgi:lipopolysaccharide transport system ATP-binding protein